MGLFDDLLRKAREAAIAAGWRPSESSGDTSALGSYGDTQVFQVFERSPPRFSTERPEVFQDIAHNLLRKDIEDGGFGLGESQSSALLNTYGREFFDDNGYWPSVFDLTNDQRFLTRAGRMQIGVNQLPPFFWMDGVLYQNDPSVGVMPAANRLGSDIDPADRKFFNYPTLTQEEVFGVLNLSTGGGGGGGGGGGRAGPIFDKESLRQTIDRIWNNILMESPATLDSLVDEFVTEATAFGGQLDLDAWVRKRARNDAKYKVLHSRKPSYQTEEQWLSERFNAASAFGLDAQTTQREVESAASQGASVAGFRERLSNSPTVQRQRTGQFSQQMAQTIAGLGAMGRA